MPRELGLVLAAVTFLTRIPIPGLAYSDDTLAHSARYFPLVGALVGALAGLAVVLLAELFPPPLCIALSMALTILLTGALHEDGWADTCDGFGGALGGIRSREDILRIMKDSRVGAFGAIGIVMMLGIKFLALGSVAFEMLPLVLIAGHAISRAAAVGVMYAGAYARPADGEQGGKSHAIASGTSALDAVVALVLGSLPLLLLPPNAAVAALAAVVSAVLLYAYFHRRLGGYTGDCLGAIQQVSELVFYLGVVGVGRGMVEL